MSNPFMKIESPEAKRRQEQAELSLELFESMIKKQMESKKGREYVWYVLQKLGYGVNILDTNASVYGKCAKQAVANDMARDIKRYCPDLFMKMENEALQG